MAEIKKVNYQERIVCLATSRKPGGRCIAGKKWTAKGAGAWVRPVSVRPGAEIELTERQYADGSEPKLLDILDVPMIAPAPRLHQTENHIIDNGFYWTKKGELEWADLKQAVDTPPTLWVNGNSTQQGSNDRVSQDQLAGLTTSLYLIKPEQVTIHVLAANTYFSNSKRTVRTGFHYKGAYYNFRLTDPDIERAFYQRDNDDYKVTQDVYLCISLAETPYEGSYYKLVAAIITAEVL